MITLRNLVITSLGCLSYGLKYINETVNIGWQRENG